MCFFLSSDMAVEVSGCNVGGGVRWVVMLLVAIEELEGMGVMLSSHVGWKRGVQVGGTGVYSCDVERVEVLGGGDCPFCGLVSCVDEYRRGY